MNNMFLNSKILNTLKKYRREKEELKVNWPRTYSILRKKDLGQARYIIYPHLKQKILWDFFVGALIMESVVVVPLRIGFHLEAHGHSARFDVFVDICFGIDMLLSFFTAFERDNNMVVNHKSIAKNYLKSWFLIDFLSTFPFDIILPLLLEGISPGTLRSIKLVRALRLFRLLKLFRVARLKRKVKDAKIEDVLHPVIFDLLGLFFWIFLMAHILSCGFFFFSGCASDDDFVDEASKWQFCGKDSLFSKYVLSMYWTIATLLSVGYGDVYLSTNEGWLFAIFVIFCGSITFGLIVSTVQSSARNWNVRKTEQMNKLSQVREYIYEKKIVGGLRRRLGAHLDYFYANKANASEEAVILEMPMMLRQYALEQTKKNLMNTYFFRQNSLDFIMELTPHLNPFICQKGDYLCKEGTFCVDMFFIVSGLVEAFKKSHDCGAEGNYLVGIYESGSELGLRNAMYCDSVAWASYRCCDSCDLMWLSNTSVHELMNSSSEMKGIFEEYAQQESDNMDAVTRSITSLSCNSGDSGVKGAFMIPKKVIHNNIFVVSERKAYHILENVDLLDEDEEVATTYKTVRVEGKNSSGNDNVIYSQETTSDMWKRWIINPHSGYKASFDFVIAMMVLLASIVVPYRMGFAVPTTSSWLVVDGITEAFFFLDLILSFFTAYELKDGTLDTIPKSIAIRYLRTWFLIDFVSAVPLYHIEQGSSSASVLVRLLKMLKLGRLVRVFKVFKIARVLKLLQISTQDFLPNEFIALESSFGNVMKMLMFLCFTTHITTCLLSRISLESEGRTWWSETSNVDSKFEMYVAGMYWTFATMATVGYGDIVAQNDSERMFSIAIMVLGSTGLAYIVSEMSDSAFNKASAKGQQDHKLSIARDYFIHNASPQSWRDAMIWHFSYLTDKKTAFDEKNIWSQLPHPLRMEVIHHVSHEDMQKIPLLAALKPSVKCTLFSYAEYCMVPQGSFMYTFETGSGGLYFVLNGYAEVIDEKDTKKLSEDEDPLMVIAAIQEGMFFGHEELFNTSFDYLGIRARTDLYTLFFPLENLEKMKTEVPLIHDTLLYIIEEAVKISFGTYDVPSNVSVIKRNISRILQMRNFVKVSKSAVAEKKAASSVFKSVSKTLTCVLKWFQSDVDEAKGLYRIFSKRSLIEEAKAKKKKQQEARNNILSDDSYEKFKEMKEKRQELLNASSRSFRRQSCRNVYVNMYRLTNSKRRLCYGQSKSRSSLECNDVESIGDVDEKEEDAGEQQKNADAQEEKDGDQEEDIFR